MTGFVRAERKKAKLKLAITGPSGSGKTMSALRLAKGLGGKIALIDTENGSASLYADRFEFDSLELSPPFTTEKYINAINAAIKAGYDTIVIDQISHAWSGPGGLLEQKEQLDSRPGSNHWTNWGPITKKQEAFKAAWLHAPINVIATMRSKQEYMQSEAGGKKKVEKVGMAPMQREGVEYEFTVVFDCAMDHQAVASKDRTSLFRERIFQITEDTGAEIKTWLEKGIDAPPPTVPVVRTPPTVNAPNKTASPTQSAQRPAAAPPPAKAQKPPRTDVPEGTYLVPFGKYEQMTLPELFAEIGEQGVVNYIDWIEQQAKTQNKPVVGKVKDFIDKCFAYQMEHQEVSPEDAPLDPPAAIDPEFEPEFDPDEPLPENFSEEEKIAENYPSAQDMPDYPHPGQDGGEADEKYEQPPAPEAEGKTKVRKATAKETQKLLATANTHKCPTRQLFDYLKKMHNATITDVNIEQLVEAEAWIYKQYPLAPKEKK